MRKCRKCKGTGYVHRSYPGATIPDNKGGRKQVDFLKQINSGGIFPQIDLEQYWQCSCRVQLMAGITNK